MVCVEIIDEDEYTGKVVNVVLATEHEDIALARDCRGQFLIYDETMQRLEDEQVRAVTIADYRERPAVDDWEQGPGALRYPSLYDIDKPRSRTTLNHSTKRSTTPPADHRPAPPRGKIT